MVLYVSSMLHERLKHAIPRRMPKDKTDRHQFADEKSIEALCAVASVAMRKLYRMRANPDCQAVFSVLTPTKSGLKGGLYEEQDG